MKKKRTYNSKYPFNRMDIGETTSIPINCENMSKKMAHTQAIWNAAHKYGLYSGRKFRTRTQKTEMIVLRIK